MNFLCLPQLDENYSDCSTHEYFEIARLVKVHLHDY